MRGVFGQTPAATGSKIKVRHSYDPKRPLISIHIPKCAGSSFRDVLRDWFGPGLLTHYVDEKRARRPEIHDLAKSAERPLCIHGHFNHRRGHGPEQYYPDVEQFITIVREPFDLQISNYFYAKRLQTKGLLRRDGQTRTDLVGMDLETYLSKRRRSFIPSFFPPELTAANCNELLAERYLFIGLFEAIQDSIDQLAEVLGFAKATIKHTNAAPRDEEVPASAHERFKEDNPLAYAIYDHARTRLSYPENSG